MAAAAGIERLELSGSTDGRGIKVVATATAGTTIHTGSATLFQELYIYAYNGHTADVALTLEWGGVTVPDDNIVVTIPFKDGLHLVTPGLLFGFNATPLIIKAFAAVASKIVLYGHANQIS